MKITDQQLSAFLDAELPEDEMEQIRNRLAEDDILAERLANLAQVDATLNQSYRVIDEAPYSDGLSQALAQAEHQLSQPKATPVTAKDKSIQMEKKDNVVEFPFWRRLSQSIQQHAAAAAVVALFVGITLGHYSPKGEQDTWPLVAQALDSVPSGEAVRISNDRLFTAAASFKAQNGAFCRQFNLVEPQQQQTSIACKTAKGWKLNASVYQQPQQQDSYQTATHSPLLESTIDQLIDGGLLNKEQEKQAILKQWQNQKP